MHEGVYAFLVDYLMLFVITFEFTFFNIGFLTVFTANYLAYVGT